MALALRLRRAAAALSTTVTPALSTTVAPAITDSSTQIFSLSKPNPGLLLFGNPNPRVRPLRFHSFHSSAAFSSGRLSDYRDNKVIAEDEILFEGCDYNHWLITMDFPKDPKPTPEEMVETYVQTLAKVVGSVEEAKKKMYACSTTTYQGFQAVMTEEMSEKFRGLPGVVFILPDSYIDPVNKQYGGDKYDNGVITPRPPPVQYGRQGRYGDQNRRYNQPRYDGQRAPPSAQGNPPRDGQPPMQGDGRYPPQQNYGPPRQDGGNYGPRQNFGPPRQEGGNYTPQQNFGPPRQDGGNYAPQQNFGPPRQDGGNYAPQQNYAPPRQDGSGYPPPGGRDGYQRDFAAGGRDPYQGERRNPMPNNYQRDFSQGQQGHSATPEERNFAQGQGGDFRQGSGGAYNGEYRQGAVPTYSGGNGQGAGSAYDQNPGPAENQYQSPQQGRF